MLLDFIRNLKLDTENLSSSAPWSEPRKLVNGTRLTDDDTTHNFGFPSQNPDFTAFGEKEGGDLTRGNGWSVGDWFIGVKPSRTQTALGQTEPNANSLIVQATDYACLHMSARPFFLFSVCVMLAGSQFCVGIFDRDGVCISPVIALWEPDSDTVDMDGIKSFIRLIRSLTCICSLTDVGHDPTVVELEDMATRQQIRDTIIQTRRARVDACQADVATLTEQMKSGPSNQSASDTSIEQLSADLAIAHNELALAQAALMNPIHPSYVFSLGGRDSRRWCTIGAPYWSSLSLLGRGTSVWLTREYKDGVLVGPELVVKNAWRRLDRLDESTIYRFVEGSHPGLAVMLLGNDVAFPHENDDGSERPITVYTLRNKTIPEKTQDMFLHRIILETVGRPLWDYRSDLELILGLRAAVQGKVFIHEIVSVILDIYIGPSM